MRTLGELRAKLADLPDGTEFLVCVAAGQGIDPDIPDDTVLVDPGAVRSVDVRRPGDGSWPYAADDKTAPPAMAYLVVGEWA